MRAEKVGEELETNGGESEVQSEFRSERADVLSQTTSIAQRESTQPSAYMEVWGLLRLFLNPWQEDFFFCLGGSVWKSS